jgi:hypothetical protein
VTVTGFVHSWRQVWLLEFVPCFCSWVVLKLLRVRFTSLGGTGASCCIMLVIGIALWPTRTESV